MERKGWLRVTHQEVPGIIDVIQNDGEVHTIVYDTNGPDTDDPDFDVSKSPLTKVNITKVCRRARLYIELRGTTTKLVVDNDLNIVENNGFTTEWIPFE